MWNLFYDSGFFHFFFFFKWNWNIWKFGETNPPADYDLEHSPVFTAAKSKLE